MASNIKSYWKNYINGEWVDGSDGGRISVEDPAQGSPICEIAEATIEDVNSAVAAAKECFGSRQLADITPAHRLQMMMLVAQDLRAHLDEIAHVVVLDTGKRILDARGEVEMAARYFEYYGGAADKLEGSSIPLGDGFMNYTIHAPFGVSAQIVPWNYPIIIAARSLAAAFATGNASIVKSPELAPLSVYMLAKSCERVGFPKGAVNVICGYGNLTGAALASHEDVNQLVFTGSVKTGQAILRCAAELVVPAIMELGGKSAGVVFPDARLNDVVEGARNGIFRHAGQICSAMSRMIVHESRYDEVVNGVVKMVEGLSIGPGIEDHDITPVMSAGQLDRVEGYCLGAAQQGATVATGGRRVPNQAGHFMPPTVFSDVTPDMTIANEEVFGPVLSILKYKEPEEAIAIANGTEYGLAAGIFTRDLERTHWAAERLDAGQVYVNQWHAGGVETPFGGMKKSGFGREKGQEALLNYVQTKSVTIRTSLP
jgi:aldehyde dehydrogenase (NAD+)